MKNTVKAVLAGMILSLSLASCTPKTETVANDADTLKVDSTQVVQVDTTAQRASEDTAATK